MNNSSKRPKEPMRIALHARTFRKAREQVKHMVQDGVSSQKIRRYLQQWAHWWGSTLELSNAQKILQCFFEHCWDIQISAYALDVMQSCITSNGRSVGERRLQVAP